MESVASENVLVQCAISGRAKNKCSTFKILVYADMIKITRLNPEKGVGAPKSKRGVIYEFSRRSRKRMLERLAQCRDMDGGQFITLTYPGEFRASPDEVKAHLNRFRKAFLRRWPESGAFWRMELKPRLSGKSQGMVVPHFHMLAFGLNPRSQAYFRRWVRVTWSRCCLIPDEIPRLVRTQCEVIKNRKHAARYASKYAAKPAEDQNDEILQLLQEWNSWGRHWGYFGNLNFDEQMTIELDLDRLVDFKRLVRRWLKSRGSNFHKMLAHVREDFGFSVFGLGDLSQDLPPPITDLVVLRMIAAW